MKEFLRCKDCKHDKGKCVGSSRRGGHKNCFERKVLTNGDRIRAMSDEELAKMLYQLHYGRDEPWSSPFARKFCDSCPKPEYTMEDGRKMNLSECDFVDGECPHGSDVVWWLRQPAEVQG